MSWTLLDGEEQNARHPDTFVIPQRSRRESLKTGEIVEFTLRGQGASQAINRGEPVRAVLRQALRRFGPRLLRPGPTNTGSSRPPSRPPAAGPRPGPPGGAETRRQAQRWSTIATELDRELRTLKNRHAARSVRHPSAAEVSAAVAGPHRTAGGHRASSAKRSGSEPVQVVLPRAHLRAGPVRNSRSRARARGWR